jgi:hypothetical protein
MERISLIAVILTIYKYEYMNTHYHLIFGKYSYEIFEFSNCLLFLLVWWLSLYS